MPGTHPIAGEPGPSLREMPIASDRTREPPLSRRRAPIKPHPGPDAPGISPFPPRSGVPGSRRPPRLTHAARRDPPLLAVASGRPAARRNICDGADRRAHVGRRAGSCALSLLSRRCVQKRSLSRDNSERFPGRPRAQRAEMPPRLVGRPGKRHVERARSGGGEVGTQEGAMGISSVPGVTAPWLAPAAASAMEHPPPRYFAPRPLPGRADTQRR